MAITIEYKYGGYTLPSAYVKASIGRADTETTVVIFNVWPTQADRIANNQPVDSGVRILPTNFEVAASNPIAYVYNLLKTLPEFENATDVFEA